MSRPVTGCYARAMPSARHSRLPTDAMTMSEPSEALIMRTGTVPRSPRMARRNRKLLQSITAITLIEKWHRADRKFRVEGARFSDLGQLFACAKFRRALTGVGEVAKRGYGQFSENPRTIPLARFSFSPTQFAWFRIVRESVANRWKIGQENSLGQTSVRLPGRYRAWLLGQRGAIAAPIICELPGNCARGIYFLAEGFNGFWLGGAKCNPDLAANLEVGLKMISFLHDVYHVSPCKPARQRSSSAKASALKTVRTACNRFQRARSSATRMLCKSSVGSSNCLLVGRMKASVKGIEAPRSNAPAAIHVSRSRHAATRPSTSPTRAIDTCMIVARR